MGNWEARVKGRLVVFRVMVRVLASEFLQEEVEMVKWVPEVSW